ncbi:GNAT family N-acetyltransferase [Ensifer soli]|uniref:GNAT family N-acetyltransferase n=1 Tax=Ciceribacter sp. sgz301302 TaxID=3342379 RepID=UPI0035B7C54A
MIVREERPADRNAIYVLTRAAFAGAPHSDGSEHRIVERLRAAGALVLSLVCEEDGAIVGHSAFSPVAIEPAADGWFGLGPISVLPERQGQGLGRRLMEAGIDAMRRAGAKGIVLLGAPEFYGKFGFANMPDLVLPDVAPQYFLCLPLSGPPASGIVAYHPAFYGG